MKLNGAYHGQDEILLRGHDLIDVAPRDSGEHWEALLVRPSVQGGV